MSASLPVAAVCCQRSRPVANARAGVHLLYFSNSGPVYKRAPISSSSIITDSPFSLSSEFFSSIRFAKTARGVPIRPEL